jgi:hypothetical protein
MKSLFAAALLLTSITASAAEFKFAPPGPAACATFAGSFTTEGQTGPEERIDSVVRCVGQPNSLSCRITLDGETGPNVFTGSVGVDNGKTFVEATRGPNSTLRLMGCKLNGRCAVVQMFRPQTKVGMMCIDTSMVGN